MNTINNKTNDSNEILFQKMGNTWYVFTEIEGELIYSVLPNGMDPYTTKFELYEVIEEHLKKISKIQPNRKAEISA